MRNLLAAAAVLAFTASPALALGIYPCGGLNRLDIIAEPWEQSTKTFYEGQVRVTLVDTWGEPACCSVHLVVLMPPPEDEPGMAVACYAISQSEGSEDAPGMGFNGVSWDSLKTSYDAAKGLLISFEHGTWDGSGEPGPRKVSKVRLNLQKNTIVEE